MNHYQTSMLITQLEDIIRYLMTMMQHNFSLKKVSLVLMERLDMAGKLIKLEMFIMDNLNLVNSMDKEN